jgi:DNA invertase Pin-like site-specific DNA recombinase
MPKAYSYLRFSTPEQAQGDSKRRQTELAKAYASANGLILDEALSFRDMGLSGYSGANVRQGALGQFLRLIDEGLVEDGSYLLVENLDRVSRQNPWDALPIFQSIINAGVTIVTLQDGRVWSRADMQTNPFRMFESLMVMIRAHEESEVKSRRLRAAWSNKRSQASTTPLTAKGPAWLRLSSSGEWEVIEERVAIVRRIFEMVAAGVGQTSIVRTLNEEQVPTWGDSTRAPAKHWHRSYISKILTSPSVIGTYVPHTVENINGKKVRTPQGAVPGYYPAIINADLYESVLSLSKDTTSPKRGRHAQTTVQNVLGGLAKCPMCGGTMTRTTKGSNPRKAGKPYLVCQKAKVKAGCRYRAVPCELVEQAIVRNADWPGRTGPAGETTTELNRRLDACLQQQEETQGRIEGLVEALASGPSPALREALDDAELTLKVLKAGESDLRDLLLMAEGPVLQRRLADLQGALDADAFDREAVNMALRRLVEDVTVDFRSGQLVFTWKFGGESLIRFAEPEDPATVPEKWRAASNFFARQFAAARQSSEPSSLPKLRLEIGEPPP